MVEENSQEPKLAFFFDEAHLLFKDAPKALIEKVEQVIRLIRSKGVSVWFITQNPTDIPDSVLGQLGNRIQHALRAYTPNDQKDVRAAANSFRANPAFDTEAAIQALGVGEALVSVLDADGIPGIVEKANILPPRSSMQAAEERDIHRSVKDSPLYDKYRKVEDRESAYEELTEAAEAAAELAVQEAEAKLKAKEEKERAKEEEKAEKERRQKFNNSVVGKITNSAITSIGRELGRQLVRGILGSLKSDR